MPYRITDHTADLGIVIDAMDLPALYVEAAYALLDLVEARTSSRTCEVQLAVTGFDREDLLIRWLQEILYRIEVEHLRIADIIIDDLGDTRLGARIAGAYIPSPLATQIKAVTYHGLAITTLDNRLTATIIFDT